MSGGRSGRLRRSQKVQAALTILAVELAVVWLAPVLFGLDGTVSFGLDFWAPPSWEHWLGTDDIARDLLARLLYGGRVSLLVGLGSAALSVSIGLPLGLLAGYLRGGWESAIMRLADLIQTFPNVVLVLCMVVLLGASPWNLILIQGILGWTGIARLVYSLTLTVREKEYILALRASGGGLGRILFRGVLPNILSPVLAELPHKAGRAILSESSLSFLGVGLRIPQSSWGSILHYAADLTVLTVRPWVWLPAGGCIVLTVCALQCLGDGLREAIDPRAAEDPGQKWEGRKISKKVLDK